MQKSTIDKTEKTLVDVHAEFETGNIDEIAMGDNCWFATMPNCDATAQTHERSLKWY